MRFDPWPLLSEADPEISAEGTLDPLGLVPIGEVLSVRMVPGVRERQRHPGYLIAMAIGAEVCRGFPEDQIAQDGISPTWQVFEWYAVEGLVRGPVTQEVSGLPGRLKVQAALRDRVGLSARRYLKAPATFGFNGVYRLLAESLNVLQDGRLSATGAELLNAWEVDQGLPGFYGSTEGPGRDWKLKLRDAVKEGLAAGSTSRTSAWEGWSFIAKNLHPQDIGNRVRRLLRDAVLRDEKGHRGEILRLLVTPEASKCWEDEELERPMHELFTKKGSPALQLLLNGIGEYERFARLLSNAFDEIRCDLTQARRRLSAKALAANPRIKSAAQSCRRHFDQASEALQPLGEAPRFSAAFQSFSLPSDAVNWVEQLLEHHRQIQKHKPPAGKNAWFDTFPDGAVMIRPAYRLSEWVPPAADMYYNPYRTGSLWSFAKDLRIT